MSATNAETTIGFHAQFARDVDGVQTEFVLHRFVNKWLILITQYGKLANFYSVQFDVKRDEDVPAPMQGSIDDPVLHMSVPISVKCNFGADSDEVRSGIQFLVNKSKLNRCPTEFVISLGLKTINGKTLREVAQVLDEILD